MQIDQGGRKFGNVYSLGWVLIADEIISCKDLTGGIHANVHDRDGGHGSWPEFLGAGGAFAPWHPATSERGAS